MDGIMQLLWQVSWQTAIFAVVVWTVTRLARKAPASWKHALWLIVLVKFFVPPFAQFPAQWAFWQTQTSTPMVTTAASPVANPITPNASPSAAPFVPTSAVFENSPTVPPSTPTASVDWHGLIPPMWLAGIALMSIILILRYRRLSALSRASRSASKEWAGMLADAGKHLGIRRLPEIRLADSVSTPMLTGLFRPVILMPSDIGRSCCSSDLLAILLHEVAHVKRLDMAVAWLQQLVQVFFFFHPAVWLAGREIRRERELACDELVLSFSGIAREDYAAGYMSALKLANGKPTGYAALAMAEPFDLEKRRLNMILHSAIPKMTARWVAAMVVLAAVGLPGCSGIRQSQDSQLQIVLQGSKQADAYLSSGKGRLTVRQLHDNEKGVVTESLGTCNIVFSGDRFKLLERSTEYLKSDYSKNDEQPIPVRTVKEPSESYDGQTYRWGNEALRGSSGAAKGRLLSIQDFCFPPFYGRMSSRSLPKAGPTVQRTGPQIVGHEIVDGEQCIVVEVVDKKMLQPDVPTTTTWRFLVNPAKGFAAPSTQKWVEGGRFKKKTLIDDIRCTLRQYSGNRWGPSNIVHDMYRMNHNTGQIYRMFHKEIIYNPNFVFGNVTADQRHRVSGLASTALLQTVIQGTHQAVSAISSGRGVMNGTIWAIIGQDEVSKGEFSYEVVFSGRSFKYSEITKSITGKEPPTDEPGAVPTPVGSIRKRVVSYDGERLVEYSPDSRPGAIVKAPEYAVPDRNNYTLYGDIVGQGLRGCQEELANSASGIHAVGTEIVDGDECIVLEATSTRTTRTVGQTTSTRRYWVNTAKGFTVSRFEVWGKGGRYSEKVLLSQMNAEARQYQGGVWGLAKVTYEEFRRKGTDRTGDYYKKSHIVVTVDSKFDLNIPVAPADIELKLPSGTDVEDQLLGKIYKVGDATPPLELPTKGIRSKPGKSKLLAETVSVTSTKERDEKTLTEMLRDGVLSEQETGQVTRILGGGVYYGLVVRYREASRHPELLFAKPEIVIDLAERLKPSPHSHLATISLWAEPSASVLTSSQALARKVVRAFHADLMAARDNYLELVEMEPKFHDDSDRFSCSTQWQPPAGQDLHSKLRLRFLSVGLPYLGNTQSDPQRVIFPLQKVSVDCYFNIKDDKLGIFVRETIDRNIQPLIKAEKVLGGKPYFENWDIDYRR